MKNLFLTTAIATLAAMPVAADNHGDAAADTAQAVENAAEQTGEAVENAAEGAANALDDAAAATEDAAKDAAAAASDAAAELEADAEQMFDTFPAPEVEVEGYTTVAAGEYEVETLIGQRVYDVNDEWVGELSEMIITEDGMVQAGIVDVGGFLGLGEKPVAIGFESFTITKADDGEEIRIYVDATEDQLEAMAEYEGS
ncbi:PRC-barrel domain-containing protein [Oceanomicrobium pacificus]|uniref:PRC-barrel domain-containing protein n=1 Tax=Oceanomicrobium pacificus TaxID=2692916 RepID=A0A6B0TXD8_9RHOB|nr:PRC-barrel domain-containing protein [Oceanomicrobium pacificus]MXU65693.1 hypothetical protein [Oceanomicrobium pacificus]